MSPKPHVASTATVGTLLPSEPGRPVDVEIWVVPSTASQEQPPFVKMNQASWCWVRGFSSLFLVCLVSSEDNVPAPPPRLPQTGHMPREAPRREAWDNKSPQGLEQIWVGRGWGEVTKPC